MCSELAARQELMLAAGWIKLVTLTLPNASKSRNPVLLQHCREV